MVEILHAHGLLSIFIVGVSLQILKAFPQQKDEIVRIEI